MTRSPIPAAGVQLLKRKGATDASLSILQAQRGPETRGEMKFILLDKITKYLYDFRKIT